MIYSVGLMLSWFTTESDWSVHRYRTLDNTVLTPPTISLRSSCSSALQIELQQVAVTGHCLNIKVSVINSHYRCPPPPPVPLVVADNRPSPCFSGNQWSAQFVMFQLIAGDVRGKINLYKSYDRLLTCLFLV